MCSNNNDIIFGIEISHSNDDSDALNIKCLRYVSMIGKIFNLSAIDAENKYSASLKVEVEPL